MEERSGRSTASVLRSIPQAIDKHLGVVFLIPGFVIIVSILIYPIGTNIYLSFTNAHLIFPDVKFVGFRNYLEFVTDRAFFNAFKVTVIWTISSVALQLLVGMITALLLRESHKRNMAFRSMLILPYALPPISVALIWRWMLNSTYGIVNIFLMRIGLIEAPIPWLSGLYTALPMAILINTWFGFPLMTISILAGLQSIPIEHYEVANIEGASAWQIFWRVTLPGIKQIVGIMVILRIIWVFNSFDILFLLTGGGPLRSTEALPILAYYTGWKSQLIGKAGALATFLFLFLLILMVFYFRMAKLEEVE
jgi:multiple sugar transport system permease protein